MIGITFGDWTQSTPLLTVGSGFFGATDKAKTNNEEYVSGDKLLVGAVDVPLLLEVIKIVSNLVKIANTKTSSVYLLFHLISGLFGEYNTLRVLPCVVIG